MQMNHLGSVAMFHKAPDRHNLNKSIENLQSEYIKIKQNNREKPNTEHVKLSKLIESFSEGKEEKYNHDAAIGICIYGLIKMNSYYDLFYGEKNENSYHLFGKGSRLGKLLQKSLNITYDNSLGEQRAFIYLTNLYHHIKMHPRKSDGDEGNAVENKKLLKDIGQVIKSLLENLSNKRPTYKALVNNFSDMPEKYRQLGGKDATRDQYAQFIKLLNQDFNEKCVEEVKEDKEWSEAYTIRYGAMLYMMEKIESGYSYLSPKGSWINPGSHFYQAGKPAININNKTKEIPNELKRKYYIDFLSYIFKIIVKPKELEKWENEYHFAGAKKFFEKLQVDLMARTGELMKGTKPGALSLSLFDVLAMNTASYGVSFALGKVTSKMSLPSTALTYFNMFRPEAALLITLLAISLNAVVTQRATNAVNRIIIDTVQQPVVVTFETIEQFGQFCVNIFKIERSHRTMELVDNPEFIKALQSLPDEIYTPEMKKKMKYVAAIDQPDMNINHEEVMTYERIITLPLGY